MSPKTLIAAGCAAVALIAASAVAVAQEGPPPHMGPPSAEMQQHMQARHAQMLADLHTVLRIRPDQEAAFKAFGDSMTPKTFEMHMDGAHGDLTLPQMMAEHAKAEAAAHDAMQAHQTAVTALYSALSPEQQKVVDALMRLRHGMGGLGMEGGMGGPGMDGPGMRIIHKEIRGGPPL